ncbi:MAG: SHOCT domain-containing protein [Candidatus Micrarchaeota archaeon]|nr:SHOCT domain-containing protein [Candidatus Micrarchaeota archaeon]MDE1848114.1 SHOCT domain-containing protein [Candidatus Micrarchaeota archaeon]MDE1863921.1 SHOCT domain-containing protein [Candidatus Micrarchaeota archaeon]
MYIGIDAYFNKENTIPYISGYARNHSGFNIHENPRRIVKEEILSGHEYRKEKIASKNEEAEALKILKTRYAKGELTKKQYLKMKKEIE